MNMRKIEDTTKRMEGENELMDERYRTTICNDCGLKPTTYFIAKRSGRYPDYDHTDSYVCISCKNRYDGLSAFGLEPQGIVVVYKLSSNVG